MTMRHQYVQIDGVSLHYVEAECRRKKASTQTVIFLHGFPEYWGAWQAQIDYFREDYRVITPDLMGYNLSDKPDDVDAYSLTNLIALYAKFVSVIGQNQPVYLVAHDWGGAIAWPLVAFHPQLFSKLVILNAAHPSTFTREIATNPQQVHKSAYIHQLVGDNGVERVQKDDFSMLKKILFDAMQGAVFNEHQQAEYRRAWRQPDAINGMLQYYRAMPQLPPLPQPSESKATTTAGATTSLKIPNIRIAIPTLILWGEQDEAFVTEVLQGIEQYVENCKIQRFADATHWLHHEKPEEVNLAIARFIASHEPPEVSYHL